MRKVLILIGILLITAAAAVVVVPEFVDWNAYRGVIAQQIERQTGRKVTFAGDVGVKLIPVPALVASDVRLSNIDGAANRDMVSLRSVELTIAPVPLLTGELHFETVRLVAPVVALEITSDGRRNWDFLATPRDAPAPSAPVRNGTPGAAGEDTPVRFDNVVIEAGTVTYADARSGRSERVDGLAATLGASSLQGPLDADGALVYRGVPMHFDLAIGQLIQGRTVPVTLALEFPSAQGRATLSGAILGIGDKPRFKGDLKADGRSLGALVHTLSGVDGLPAPLLQSFGIESDLLVTPEKASAEKATLHLGDTKAAARVEFGYADRIDFTVALDVPRLNLDAMLARPTTAPAAPTAKPASPATPAAGSAGKPKPTGAGEGALSLPADIHGVVDVTADTITYREGIVSQFRLSAEVTGGDMIINQLSAQLPGGSEAAVFGVASLRPEGPRFEGSLDARASDFRRILKWVGLPDPQIDPDRLRTVSLRAAQFIADPEQIQLAGVDAQVDGSRVTGGITMALRARPAFGAGFDVDRLNLDSYMPKPAAPDTAAIQPQGMPGPVATPAPSAAPQGDLAFEALTRALKGFGDFDCNVRLGIRHLVARDVPIQDVKVDATLVQGVLTVRDLSAGELAGAAVAIKGGFDSTTAVPEFKALNLSVRTQDPERLIRFLDLSVPVAARDVGPVVASATLDGRLIAPRIQASLQGRDLDLTTEGEVVWLPAPGLDLKTRLRHKDVGRLVRMSGADYRPVAPLGAVDVSGRVRVTTGRATVEGFAGQIGPVRAEGTLSLATSGPRPKLAADLKADILEIDRFLPAKRSAMIGRPRWGSGLPQEFGTGLLPAAVRKNTAGDRWSHNPIDLAALRSFDAEVKLVAGTLAYGSYRLEQAATSANLANGILKFERLAGRLFGGELTGQGSLESLATPQLGLSFSLKGGRLQDALKAAAGADAATGAMDLDLALSGAGMSEADIVSSLVGQGTASLRGIDVRKGGPAAGLAAVVEVLRGLDGLGGLAGGTRDAPATADVTGTFRVEDGIARSDDLKLVAPTYDAAAKAAVDLPRWQIKADGTARLSGLGVDALPFSVSGSLDAPDVKLSTPENLRNMSIRVPEKLLKDKDARRQLLDTLKKGLLGTN